MTLPPPDPKFDLRGASGEISCLHFSCNVDKPCPPLLFSGSSSGQIHVWNLNTRRAETVLNGHNGKSVYWIHTLHNRDSLMSQGRDLQICKWNLSQGRNEVTDSIAVDSVGFCKCSLLNKEHCLLAMPGRESSQPKSGSSPLLIVGYEDGSVALWNVLEHRMMSRLVCHKEPVISLDFDCMSDRGVSGSAEKILSAWILDEQQNLKNYKVQELVNPGIADITIRQDKKILATGGWDYRVRVFGWKKMKPLAVLQYHSASVHCVSFSDHIIPEERLLAAGSKDQRISLWSIYPQS
ncbi:guanine nucleotide-binding protein subunit beta-like protein 1 isoform X2 [Pseudophryne corroboree]|uniref:guanine nucleotide-binding protein subunit beta-like protein 1 isoform X2 n=1 Tax=Pseudophryne corroboree TaxID=495146 RepID=UPI003081F495